MKTKSKAKGRPKGSVNKKPATKPWNSSDNPWSQDIFRTKKVHKGFRPKWVSKTNLDRKMDYGYTIANREDYGETDRNPSYLQRGLEGFAGLDSMLVRRSMVLMEIPEEKAKQREKWLRNQNKDRIESTLETVANEGDKINQRIGRKIITAKTLGDHNIV